MTVCHPEDMTKNPNSAPTKALSKGLGLARGAEDALSRIVLEAGWTPVTYFTTHMLPTGAPAPIVAPDALLILSPSSATVNLPPDVPILATGEGTARALRHREVLVPDAPSAERLWKLLQQRFPAGGDFLLLRGERSRGFLESASNGTHWRLHPWITHAEQAIAPLPELPPLDAVMALSPLQAEILGPISQNRLRFAWGTRTGAAFEAAGYPAHGVCEPTYESLRRMLARF